MSMISVWNAVRDFINIFSFIKLSYENSTFFSFIKLRFANIRLLHVLHLRLCLNHCLKVHAS